MNQMLPLDEDVILKTKNLSVFFDKKEAVKSVDLELAQNKVTAIIGPSGCGKSTLLRTFNRMHDLIPNARTSGEVFYKGRNILEKQIDPVIVRQQIGMVFQRPNPFPRSIYDNIVWGAKINGFKGNHLELVESCLKKAALWDEVKDRLFEPATRLSGGQQQRLCIARSIALKPKIILMDEPCSALDPKSTARIEDLINDLKENYAIIIVTHNMQQAARVSEYTAFFYEGELVEFGKTQQIFTNPSRKQTEDYISGRFG